MSDSLKIRNVLDDPRGEDLCLNDVIMALASSSEQFRHLEYKNSAHSYREASKAWNAAKKKFKDFEVRLRGEIKESIVKEISRIDKRVDPKGNNDEFFEVD